MVSRLARFLSFLFVAWLIVVAVVDVRLGEWWRYAATVQLALERLQTGEWHPENWIAHLKALTFLLVFVLAAYGAGRPLAARLVRESELGRERAVLATLLGMTALGLLTFFLGVTGFWSRGAAAILLGLFSLLALAHLFRGRRAILTSIRQAPRAWTALEWVLLAVGAAAIVLVVLYALSPPVQSDALRYHLAAPDRWRQLGRIVYLPHYAHSNMPFLVEMNFALALMAGLPAAAQLVHVAYWLVAAVLLSMIVGQMAPGRSGLAASVLLLTHPIAAPVAAWPNVDLASLAYLLAMAWAAVRWLDKPSARWLMLAGVMGGGAFACKYTNLLPAAFVGAVILLFSREEKALARRIFNGVRNAALFSALVVLVCSPWLIRNVMTTGNPVYPLAYSIFGGDDWSGENAAFYSAKAAEKGTARAIEQEKMREAQSRGRKYVPDFGAESVLARVKRLMLIPWNTYRWPGAFEASAQGPLMLLVFPVFVLVAVWMLVKKPDPARWFYFGFVLFLLASWAATYQSNRFLLPVPALLAVYLAVLSESRSGIRVPALAAIGFLLVAQFSWVFQFILLEPYGALRYSLGKESRQAYLSRNINYYDAADWLSANVPEGQGVFLAGEHRTFYFEAPVLGADWFDTPAPLTLIRESEGRDPIDVLLQRKMSYLYLNADELLAGPYAGAMRQALGEAEEADRQSLLLRILENGPRAILADAPALGEGPSNYDYFRRRFSEAEWGVWLNWLRSERMKLVYQASPMSVVYALGK